jgi:hypothetical protein
VGLIAASLQASSFLWVIYDRKYWNATPIPLLSIITIICLYKIAKGKLRWTYLLALVLAIAFHAHMTSGALFLFVFISWLVLKLPVKKPKVLSAIAFFLSLQLPLLLFEFRHQFLNTKALRAMLFQSNQSLYFGKAVVDVSRLALTSAARLFYATLRLDIANELTLCSQYAETRFQPPIWAAVLAVATIAFLINKRKTLGHKLLVILLGVNFTGITWYRLRAGPGNWYPGQLSEYFFLPSFPAIFLGFASLSKNLILKLQNRAWLVKLGLMFLVLSNAIALFTSTHSDGFSLKRLAVREVIKVVGDQPFAFNVESEDPCRLYGYRYLFSVYRKEPAQSYLDPQFGWLYERRLPKTKPSKKAIINSESGEINIMVENFGDPQEE